MQAAAHAQTQYFALHNALMASIGGESKLREDSIAMEQQLEVGMGGGHAEMLNKWMPGKGMGGARWGCKGADGFTEASTLN